MSTTCNGCMQRIEEIHRFCPLCGYDQQTPAESGLYIVPGTELNGYKFGRVLGHGGFGITYIGQHIPSGEVVAIKEFYPNGMAGRTATQTVSAYAQKADAFQLGLEKFRQEAQLIGQFNDFPGIVDSRDYFEAMGTGYFIMEYIEGVTVKDYVAQQGGRVSFQAVKAILMPIMDALSEMHRHNIIHRDISPENIYITKDKRVKLLDFGAARFANAQDNHSMSIILKHGYAPKEQYYTKGSQGPWTDVYAVAATAYYMLTGQTPQSCIERIEQDRLVAPSRIDGDIGFIEEQVLMVALSINEIDRYQTMSSFQKALLRIDTTSSQDIMQQVQSGQITQSQPSSTSTPPSVQPSVSDHSSAITPLELQKKKDKSTKPAKVKQPKVKKIKSIRGVLPDDPMYPAMKKKRSIRILAACIAAFIVLSAGGFITYRTVKAYQLAEFQRQQQITYDAALRWIKSDSYEKGQELLATLPSDYADASAWHDYAQVGILLTNEEPDEATQLLSSITQVDDVLDFENEILYVQATIAHREKDFGTALKLYSTLIQNDYRDSDEQHHTVLLDEAQFHLDNKDWRSALRKYSALPQDQFVRTQLVVVKDGIYNDAISKYRSKKYTESVMLFNLLGKYKSSTKYLYLLSIHYLNDDFSYDPYTVFQNHTGNYFYSMDGHDLYNTIKGYGSFEDAKSLLMSDYLIQFFLEGKWTLGGDYFKIYQPKSKLEENEGKLQKWFSAQYTFSSYDGKYYDIRDGIYYLGSNEKGWQECFRFTYVSQDKIKIYIYRTKKTFTLTRK